MRKTFFDDFKTLSKSAQNEKIQADIGGSTQYFETPEGISLQPIYHKEDAAVEKGFTAKANSWKLGQYIQFTHTEECLNRTEDALANGAEVLYFVVEDQSEWIADVLQRIAGKATLAYFFFKQAPSSNVIQQINSCDNAILLYDPFGRWVECGTPLLPNDADHYIAKTATLFVDAAIYANAGAHAVQQIAFGLAQLNEYMTQFSASFEGKIEVVVRMAQGSSYFMEMAKLIAFRSLAATMLGEYPLQVELKIIAEPLQRNKSRVDYNVNLLRTSSEMMSAILGEADVVVNHPYDLRFNPPSHFSDRMARNQLLILKHESYFDQFPKVTQGAYFIETLIRELKQSSWTQFLAIEAAGGWMQEIQKNNLQEQISLTQQNEQALIDQGKSTVVGVNKYFDETALSAPTEERKENALKSLIQPLKLKYTTS